MNGKQGRITAVILAVALIPFSVLAQSPDFGPTAPRSVAGDSIRPSRSQTAFPSNLLPNSAVARDVRVLPNRMPSGPSWAPPAVARPGQTDWYQRAFPQISPPHPTLPRFGSPQAAGSPFQNSIDYTSPFDRTSVFPPADRQRRTARNGGMDDAQLEMLLRGPARVRKDQLERLTRGPLAYEIGLGQQLEMQRVGDVARRLQLAAKLQNRGGWEHRHTGLDRYEPVDSRTTTYYGGPEYCPHRYAYPQWTAWVPWCWEMERRAKPDTRPARSRPQAYSPSPAWTWSHCPDWTPLHPTVCGTWIRVPLASSPGRELQLLAVRFVDPGHPDAQLGPRYRVWLRNNSRLAMDNPFNVVLLMAPDARADERFPQAGVRVTSMRPGEIQAVDIRLPVTANRIDANPSRDAVLFSTLHVIVDSHHEVFETNETNNGAVLVRGEILPVDPTVFMTDVTETPAGGVIRLAGEGFGPEPGQVLINLNGLEVEGKIQRWFDLGIAIRLPQIPLSDAADAVLLVVRGDGAAANPLPIRITVPDTANQPAN